MIIKKAKARCYIFFASSSLAFIAISRSRPDSSFMGFVIARLWVLLRWTWHGFFFPCASSKYLSKDDFKLPIFVISWSTSPKLVATAFHLSLASVFSHGTSGSWNVVYTISRAFCKMVSSFTPFCHCHFTLENTAVKLRHHFVDSSSLRINLVFFR